MVQYQCSYSRDVPDNDEFLKYVVSGFSVNACGHGNHPPNNFDPFEGYIHLQLFIS